MPRTFVYIIILVLAWFKPVAQPDLTLPPYRQYTLRDGLSQMQVLCMLQDSRGYIWIGTKGGLNYFNGEKIIKITLKDSLSDDYIYQIIEDQTGKIWFSNRKAITSFDGNEIRNYPFKDFNVPPSIVCDDKNRIWYYATDEKRQGYFGYLDNGNYHSVMDGFPEKEKIFVPGSIYFRPKENRYIFAYYQKWYSYCNGRFEFIAELYNYFPFLSKSGRFYLVGESDYDRNVYELIEDKLQLRAVVKNGEYTGNTSLKDTIRLIDHIEAKIHEFTPDYFHEFTLANHVPSANPLIDRDGNIWYGTEEGPLQMYGEAFTTYSRQYLPMVWGITEDNQGNIWFSSFSFGIKKLAGDKITEIKFQDPMMNRNLYFHPSVDKRGRMYFPGYNGIIVSDGKNFAQHKLKTCITTYYDKDLDLLFTGDHAKVRVYNKDLTEVRNIGENAGFNVGANVMAINKDQSGHYWFSGGKGLVRYNWQTGKVENYNAVNGRFNAGVSWVIHNDYRNRTWFGTKNGLFWYDLESDSLKKLESEQITGSVNLIASIDSSWLVVSQPIGIYLLNLQKYYKTGEAEFSLYNEKNGFLGIEPGQDGAFTDSKGNLWMTTGSEVVKLDPKKLKPGHSFVNLRVAKLNGKPLPFNTGLIELPRNQNSAVLNLDAICFNRPNPVEFSWKLADDSSWSAWQTENYIVLSDLPDGKTKLQVKARIQGLPLDHPATLGTEIKVSLAIYRQPWFFPMLFALITFTGVIFLLISLLKLRKADRQSKVFQVQAIQSQMNPHFIFNVLASLQSMILKANISKANDYLVKLADLVRGFLESSAGTGTIKSPNSNEGLVTIAAELKLLNEFVHFQQLINPGKFEFEVNINAAVDQEMDLIPPLLIQPFLENAIRHGLLQSRQKGLLQLSFTKESGVLIITISDNGIGIENARKMLEQSSMRYTSRGKELTLNRIKLLNQLGFGIEVETQSSNNGTDVKISVKR